MPPSLFPTSPAARALGVGLVTATALSFGVVSADAAPGDPAVIASTGAVTITTNGSVGVPVAMPAGVAPGDLLLVVVASDLNNKVGTTVGSAGWTKVLDAKRGTDVTHLTVFAKLAAGNDTFSVATTFTPNTFAEDLVAQSLRITNHGVTDVTTGLAGLGAADANTGSANPPSTGALPNRNWLVLALAAPNFTSPSDTLSKAPTGYTTVTLTKSAKTNSSATLGVAWKAVGGTGEDPGKFTNTARSWVAATIAIPPAGA